MFAYIILESLAEAGVKVGLPRDVATLLTAQTMKGSTSVVRIRISISGQDHLRKQKSDRRRDDPHGLGADAEWGAASVLHSAWQWELA